MLVNDTSYLNQCVKQTDLHLVVYTPSYSHLGGVCCLSASIYYATRATAADACRHDSWPPQACVILGGVQFLLTTPCR